MNLTNLLGARLGLEEISEDLEGNDTVASDTGEMANSIIELDKADSDVTETNSKMTMLTDATESLERVALALEGITTQTLSMESATLLNLAYENAIHPMAKYGDTEYRGKASEGSNTEDQKKGIFEKLKEAWRAFVKMVAKIWDAVTNFVSRLFSTAAMMQRKAEALLSKVKSVKNNPNAKPFEMNVNELQVNGKVPKAVEIVAHVKVASQIYHNCLVGKDSLLSNSFYKEYEKMVHTLCKKSLDPNEYMRGDKQDGFFALTDVLEWRLFLKQSTAKAASAADIGMKAPADIAKMYEDTAEVYISRVPLLGDRVFVFISKATKNDDKNPHDSYLNWMKGIRYDVISNRSPSVERAEIEPCLVEDIELILGKVIDTCKDIVTFKKEWLLWMKTAKKIENMVSEYMDKNERGIYQTDEERAQAGAGKKIPFMKMDAFKAFLSLLRATGVLVSGFASFETKISKQAMRNCHALISYSHKSLNAHTGTTAADDVKDDGVKAEPKESKFTNSRDDISDADLVV